MGKLNNTEALVRQGIRRPGPRPATFGGNVNVERGADDAMASGRNSGHFRKETDSGPEGLSEACKVLKEGC